MSLTSGPAQGGKMVAGEEMPVTVEDKQPTTWALTPGAGWKDQVAGAVDRLSLALARHWLAIFNLMLAVFVGLAFLAPVLMQVGAPAAGRAIYWLYSLTCHQLPERSFFLFGPQATYRLEELEALGALPAGLSVFQRQALHFPGSPQMGYKVALCQRDVAVWGSMLVAGVLFALVRGWLWRRRVASLPRLPLWAYALCLVPLAIDGGTQLVGWRESTWQLRLVTGGLFGAATVWLAYPYVQEAMDDVLRGLKERSRQVMGGSGEG
jgi:uncharacterized membrane protein